MMAAIVHISDFPDSKRYDFSFQLDAQTNVRLNRKAEDTAQAFFSRLCSKVPEAKGHPLCFLGSDGSILLSSEASTEAVAQPIGPLTDQATHIRVAGRTIPLIKNPGVPSNVGFGHVTFSGIPYFLSVQPQAVLDQLTVEWYAVEPDSLPRAPKRAKQSPFAQSPAVASGPGSPGSRAGGELSPSPFIPAIIADDLAYIQENVMGFNKVDASTFGRKCGEGSIFTPTDADIGKLLFVRISPRECPAFFMQLACPIPIQPSPPRAAWYHRRSDVLRSHGKSLGTLRVACWNILAPAYTGSAYAKEALFPFCDYCYLEFKYRRGLITKELLEFNADMWCLQECGEEVTNDLIIPLATHLGMDCQYALKFGKAREGVLIAYKTNTWELVEVQKPLFKDIMVVDAELAPLRDELNKLWPEFVGRIVTSISSVYLVCVLRNKQNGKKCVIANTHLYYHPNASHIRALQSFVLLLIIDRLRKKLGEDVQIIITGDLNSTERTGAIELITKGAMAATHPTWEYAPKFGTIGTRPPVTEEAAIETTPAPLPFTVASTGPALISPLGNNIQMTQEPLRDLEFTTHVGQFHAILDWILVSKNIHPRWSLQGPPLSAIQHEPGQTIGADEGVKPGLPTAGYPSDHIPVITDLVF